MGSQISWLLPAALILLGAGLVATPPGRRDGPDPGRPGALGRLAAGDRARPSASGRASSTRTTRWPWRRPSAPSSAIGGATLVGPTPPGHRASGRWRPSWRSRSLWAWAADGAQPDLVARAARRWCWSSGWRPRPDCWLWPWIDTWVRRAVVADRPGGRAGRSGRLHPRHRGHPAFGRHPVGGTGGHHRRPASGPGGAGGRGPAGGAGSAGPAGQARRASAGARSPAVGRAAGGRRAVRAAPAGRRRWRWRSRRAGGAGGLLNSSQPSAALIRYLDAGASGYRGCWRPSAPTRRPATSWPRPRGDGHRRLQRHRPRPHPGRVREAGGGRQDPLLHRRRRSGGRGAGRLDELRLRQPRSPAGSKPTSRRPRWAASRSTTWPPRPKGAPEIPGSVARTEDGHTTSPARAGLARRL